jgi:DNA-binding MarR family transcriptional regulator
MKSYEAFAYQSRITRSKMARVNEYLRFYNLTAHQWTVLGLIYDGHDHVTKLAQALDTSLAHITNVVNFLEKEGWVARASDQKDSRKTLLTFVGDVKKFKDIDRMLRRI